MRMELRIGMALLLVWASGPSPRMFAADWERDFKAAVDAVASEKFEATISPSVANGSAGCLQMESFPNDSAVAAVRLFILEDFDRLALAWVEQRNRSVRAFIAALLFADESLWPHRWAQRFSAINQRFSKPESTEREEELNFAVKSKKMMAATIHRALDGVLDEKRLKGFKFTAEEK